jgi:hypothetical protein
MRQTSPILSIVFLFAATIVGAQRLPGQSIGPAQIAADTGTVAEGRQAGTAAAGEVQVVGRAAVGFIGGLPIGFLGILVTQGDPAGPIGVGTGLLIIGAAARLGDTRPPRTQSLSERGDSYRRAFTESYGKRLLQRRGKAAMLGGLAGAVTGFGLLLALISQIDT